MQLILSSLKSIAIWVREDMSIQLEGIEGLLIVEIKRWL